MLDSISVENSLLIDCCDFAGMTCLVKVPLHLVRARVTKICGVSRSSESLYEVYTLDYGRTLTVERSKLRRYDNDVKRYFDEFPPLAVACSLRGCRLPMGKDGSSNPRVWTMEETKQMKDSMPFAK